MSDLQTISDLSPELGGFRPQRSLIQRADLCITSDSAWYDPGRPARVRWLNAMILAAGSLLVVELGRETAATFFRRIADKLGGDT